MQTTEPRYECAACPAAFDYYSEAAEHAIEEHFDPEEWIADRHNAAPEDA